VSPNTLTLLDYITAWTNLNFKSEFVQAT